MERYISIFAQAAEGAAPQETGTGGSFWIFIVLMFAGMWFLLIAPQRKRQKEAQKMVESLENGDEVVTIGGIYGVITNRTEKTFTLRVEDGKIEVLRTAVSGKVQRGDKAEEPKQA